MLVAELLSRRVGRDGGAPLVTYYDLVTGERTELSGTTVANWVAKTSNLIVDELLLDEGDPVELALAASHPGHWVTLVWQLACWQTGTVVTLGRRDDARVVVCGPEWSLLAAGPAELVACALHPLGMGFPQALPGGVVDYALEVRGQPDRHLARPVAAEAAAWVDADGTRSQADLVAGEPGPPRRRLVRPGEPWPTARDAVVRPLRDGGSTVLVAGPEDPARLDRIRADERVDQAG